jgi:hypothetical protein
VEPHCSRQVVPQLCQHLSAHASQFAVQKKRGNVQEHLGLAQPISRWCRGVQKRSAAHSQRTVRVLLLGPHRVAICARCPRVLDLCSEYMVRGCSAAAARRKAASAPRVLVPNGGFIITVSGRSRGRAGSTTFCCCRGGCSGGSCCCWLVARINGSCATSANSS